MNFEEVRRFKQVFKTGKIVFDGLEFDIFVVPNHRDDFTRYCDQYRGKAITDESALDFCSDQKFQLMALYSDDKSVQYKKLG